MGNSESPIDRPQSAKDGHEWDIIERDFWDRFNSKHAADDAEAERNWHEAKTDIRVEMAALSSKRTILSETRDRLTRELMVIDQEFAGVVKAHSEMAEKLNQQECAYREKQHHHLEERKHMAQNMIQWFRESRRGGNLPESGPVTTIADKRRLALQQLQPAEGLQKHQTPADALRQPLPSTLSSPPVPLSQQQRRTVSAPESVPLVEIVSHEGAVIGAVKRIEPWNQFVQTILQFPIRRPVRIRPGRTFNANHLDSIYERVDARGTRWLSCMIQATGTVQAQRCQSCEKDHGAFAECVVVGGPMFPKCGNCEWNKQGCHPGAGPNIKMPIREPPRALEPPIMNSSHLNNPLYGPSGMGG